MYSVPLFPALRLGDKLRPVGGKQYRLLPYSLLTLAISTLSLRYLYDIATISLHYSFNLFYRSNAPLFG